MNTTQNTPYLDTLRKIGELTANRWVISKAANLLWRLAEYSCYLVVLAMVVLALFVPTGDLALLESDAGAVYVRANDVRAVMLLVKLTIAALGLFWLLPARLFRKVRKKNTLLEEIHSLAIDAMKQA